MNYYDPFKIHFRLDCGDSSNKVNLYELTNCFDEFHSILDKTYGVIMGYQRRSRTHRENFQVIVSDFSEGFSLITLEIVITGAPELPALGFTNPITIWEFTKGSFNLLKTVYSSMKNGENPIIQTSKSGEVSVVVGSNKVLKFEHKQILDIAIRSKRYYKNLALNLRENGIRKIEVTPLGATSTSSISLDYTDKVLFNLESKPKDTPIIFRADIYDFNKEDNTGRLRVLKGQNINDGEYDFSIYGKQEANKYIEAMLEKSVYVKALEVVEDDPFEGIKLVGFQVIDLSYNPLSLE
jgi:hypothetical protein